MSGPAAPDFIRYLAAKKGLDDRSLNRRCGITWPGRYRTGRTLPPSGSWKWAAVSAPWWSGCWIGFADPGGIHRHRCGSRAYPGGRPAPGRLCRGAPGLPYHGCRRGHALYDPTQDVRITLEAADLFDFLHREPGKRPGTCSWAHAVLDLIDLGSALPRLLSRLAPGGLFYFSLNFDGATIL